MVYKSQVTFWCPKWNVFSNACRQRMHLFCKLFISLPPEDKYKNIFKILPVGKTFKEIKFWENFILCLYMIDIIQEETEIKTKLERKDKLLERAMQLTF